MTRKELDELLTRLEGIQAAIQGHHDELEEQFSERSEKWQDSDAGQDAQGRVDTWQSAADALDTAVSDLNDAIHSA